MVADRIRVISVSGQKMGIPKKPVFLRQDLTSRLVKEIHGGFIEMAVAWEEMAEERPNFPRPKAKSTIQRWLPNGVPVKRPNPESPKDEGSDLQLFGFCALLDVDPLAIFDYKRNGYFSSFSVIRQLVYFGQRALGGLAPLLEMYRPGDVWPSDEIALACYGRQWFAHEFTNAEDWKRTDYILVKVKFLKPIQDRPRSVHIAYRRIGVPDTMWRYFGTVLSIDEKLQLYNESGDYQSMDQIEQDEIRFRTYYGGRPVEWRIVSLHEFKVSKEFPFNDMKTIGFNW